MMEAYEASDSEDDYTNNEKLLLDRARKSLRKRTDESDEDEVLGLGSDLDEEALSKSNIFHGGGEEFDDDDDDGNDDDIDMGSDLDDPDDGLPDDRAWGQRRKNFYSTDYVDQDYGGVLQGKEAEAAELEEQEARNIQKRLVEQLNDADFALSDLTQGTQSSESKAETYQTDLSQLSKRQKLDLFNKEAPEFSSLIDDFQSKLMEAQHKLCPVLDLVKNKKLSSCLATDFVNTKLQIILNYCTNISFYLLLKSKRLPVRDHPVLQSLYRYRRLLEQLQPLDQTVSPQIKDLLAAGGDVDSLERKGKKKLKLLSRPEKKEKKVKKPETESEEEEDEAEQEKVEEKSSSGEEEMAVEEGDGEKRAITYEMAKNKGLIPKRSKEQRNPRVKHRNKYRKAKIRRRGQVRLARTEIPAYGGEPGGIKIGLKKSIKIK